MYINIDNLSHPIWWVTCSWRVKEHPNFFREGQDFFFRRGGVVESNGKETGRRLGMLVFFFSKHGDPVGF